jgi:predicted DNA-binding protein (MmcQ/YjbR family)
MEYAQSLKGAEETYPFDETTLVLKVMGKMFLLKDVSGSSISLKCNPWKSLELQEIFDFITPGYHLNKKHWISVEIRTEMPLEFYRELIDHSYEEVVKKLPKKDRETLI